MFKKLMDKVKLFNKPINKIGYSDDSFIKTVTVYNEEEGNNLIILIEITEDYGMDMIELVAACGYMHTKFLQTSTPRDELDENGEPLQDYHNYLLIGGTWYQYKTLIQNTPLSNPILIELFNELYENCDAESFRDLIDDGIMNESLFTNTGKKDKMLHIVFDAPDGSIAGNKIECDYDSLYKLHKKLPLFGIEYLLKFVNTYITSDCHDYTLDKLIQDAPQYIDMDEKSILKIFDGITINGKPLTIEDVKNLVKPLYKINVDKEDESISDLDDLFKQKYDRFNGVSDGNIEYLDIDDEIEEDEEESDDKEDD